MVKKDMKMVGISQQGLMLRSLVEQQIDKIDKEELKIKRLIE
jgi:hypothetical protein